MILSLCAFGLMIFELIVAEFIFSGFMRRKKFFWLRFLGAVSVCLAASFSTLIIYSIITERDYTYNGVNELTDSVFKFIFYIAVFLMTVATFRYSFEDSVWTVLFYCSGGYALQHIAWNVFSCIRLIPAVNSFFSAYEYLSFLFELLCCAAIYAVTYFAFIRKRSAPDEIKDIRGKVGLFLTVIVVCILISRFTTDIVERDLFTQIAESAAAILNCAFVLAFLFDMTDKDRAKNELQVMKEVMRREKEQYEFTKESIDLINIKYHDLKHQIRALRENLPASYIKEIEDAAMFYDAAAKTGNNVLDVILTGKSLLFEQNNITFTCVVRGEDLSFMDDMDIYSLFGNALSNAFETVCLIGDEDRRCISLNVRRESDSLSIHIENFYDGEILFENGLPATTKNKEYHGYGIKSMDFIARKYNGYMNITTDDGIFCVDFVFPLAQEQP